MTTLEGLTDLRFPCARVLSVSGFLVIPSLFPLGEGFILSVITSLITRRYERFLTFLTGILPTVRRCSVLNINPFMTDRRPGDGRVINNEQSVHRGGAGEDVPHCSHTPMGAGRRH